MKPSEIRRLLESSKVALTLEDSAPDAFLLAFVAWEAFQIRVLVVGLAAKGLSVAESYKIIKDRKVWKGTNRDALFQECFESLPRNTKHIGRHYTKALRFKTIRDRYVHGFGRTSPELFIRATEELIGVVEQDWESDLRKLLKQLGRSSTFTNPLGTIRATTIAPGKE